MATPVSHPSPAITLAMTAANGAAAAAGVTPIAGSLSTGSTHNLELKIPIIYPWKIVTGASVTASFILPSVFRSLAPSPPQDGKPWPGTDSDVTTSELLQGDGTNDGAFVVTGITTTPADCNDAGTVDCEYHIAMTFLGGERLLEAGAHIRLEIANYKLLWTTEHLNTYAWRAWGLHDWDSCSVAGGCFFTNPSQTATVSWP